MAFSLDKHNINKNSFILVFICTLFALGIFEQLREQKEQFRLTFPTVKLPFGIQVSLGKLSL